MKESLKGMGNTYFTNFKNTLFFWGFKKITILFRADSIGGMIEKEAFKFTVKPKKA